VQIMVAVVPPDRRFRREDRLRKRTDFESVYAAARKSWARGFTVFVAPGAAGRHRLGLAVGRRVGRAVLRNRVKRRLREAFRLSRESLPGCYDIVVHGRAEVADIEFSELVRSLVGAVRRAATGGPRQRSRRRGDRK
jgi:ribonuclease P protein component